MSEQWSVLEREYSPSSRVESLSSLIDDYRLKSLEARSERPPICHSYGDLPCETLDVFPAQPGSTAHIFIHGGYWQELSKEDSSFPAIGFAEADTTFIAVDYGLAPNFSLDEIVAQVRRAIAWVYTNHSTVGIDPERIVVSGSSAGAHLTAMAALTDWASMGLPTNIIRGLVLLSGIYDLEPLIDTYINEAVGMDWETAHRNSPLRQLSSAPHGIPAIVAWGDNETDAFKAQSRWLAEAWSAVGNPVSCLEAPGRNHFDIVHDLSHWDSPLGSLIQKKSEEWHGNTAPKA